MKLTIEKPEIKAYGGVVSLMEYKNRQREKIREWLAKEAGEKYGLEKVEACLENPYMRLLLKYDGVNEKVKECMFLYAEKVMAELRGR